MDIEIPTEDKFVILCVQEGQKFSELFDERGVVFRPVYCNGRDYGFTFKVYGMVFEGGEIAQG